MSPTLQQWARPLFLAACLLAEPSSAALQSVPAGAADQLVTSDGLTQRNDLGVAATTGATTWPHAYPDALDAGAALVTLDDLPIEPRRTVLAASPTSGYTPDVALWLLVRHVHSLRERDYLDAFESELTYLLASQTDPVSPVPLPASLWFLATGLLGMIGIRLQPSRGATVHAGGARLGG
jgi:hypothetical protein